MSYLATACNEAKRPTAPPEPSIGAVPTITEPQQIQRPIDAYVPTAAQVLAVLRNQAAHVTSCMKDFGFSYGAPIVQGLTEAAARRRTRNPMYGLFDMNAAKTSGYQLVLPPDQPSTGSRVAPLSPDEIGVLTGMSATGQPMKTFAGKGIPDGGCEKVGRTAIGGSMPAPDEAALPDGGPKVPANDSRIVDAVTQWSECVRAKGFHYSSPIAAMNDQKWQTGDTVSSAEIATATADVACKVSINLIGTAVAVQTAYDKRYIGSHSQQLAAYRSNLEAAARN
jgi:hypothetical protein